MNSQFWKSALPLVTAALVAACASTPSQESKQATATSNSGQSSVAATPQTLSVGQATSTMNPLNDPNNILARRSIYYDYDKSDIKPEFRPVIEAHAKYLRDHPGTRIAIQGNCDERGSHEYNIALGERRSQGVMKMMVLLGVPESQMEAVSFGEEKPRALGHDEASWSVNRRSDIAY